MNTQFSSRLNLVSFSNPYDEHEFAYGSNNEIRSEKCKILRMILFGIIFVLITTVGVLLWSLKANQIRYEEIVIHCDFRQE